jgi:hypothetical protein
VITWKDFVLDDIVGPVLMLPEEALKADRPATDGRVEGTRLGSPEARNGASGNNSAKAEIQETRPEQRPARMVGSSSHDSAQVDRKSAGSDRANNPMRPRGGTGN